MPWPPDNPTALEHRLERIALAHRALMFRWLVNVLCAPLVLAMLGLAILSNFSGWAFWALLAVPAILANALPLVALWRLSAAMGERWPGTLVCTAVCAVPGFSLLLLFSAGQEASEHLRPLCGAVPFLGFTRARFAIARNGCPSCGYPLTGLRGNICPECGRVVEPVAAPA